MRDLFFNVPARRKFLRSEQTELAHIASLVTHYSLAHPGRSFELTHEGRQLLAAPPVATAAERVFQIFGAETLEELIELEPRRAAEGRFTLSGFVSRPQVQKTNRNSIFLFVNRRLIRDRLLLHAISAAYANLMPPSAFPFALLFLDCDPGEVDVNVHPSKTEVRFRAASFVHDFVRDSLREALVASRPAPAAPPPSPLPRPASQPAARLPYSEFTQALEGLPPHRHPAGHAAIRAARAIPHRAAGAASATGPATDRTFRRAGNRRRTDFRCGCAEALSRPRNPPARLPVACRTRTRPSPTDWCWSRPRRWRR